MKIVTDLDKFSLEQIWRPYQTMAGFDKHLEKAPFSLEATAAALREETEWSKVVLDRLRAIGIKFPPYIVHPLVDVVTGRAVEKRAPPSDMNEWRASSSIDGPSESGYYSAGIDIPFKDWRGLTNWHDHAIQVHRKDQAEAVSIRDAILAARHVAGGEHLNESSSEKATEPGSESRAERLMHAMEGELDGFTCDMESAMRILAHVDAVQDGAQSALQILADMADRAAQPVAFAHRQAIANLAMGGCAMVCAESNNSDLSEIPLYTRDAILTAIASAQAYGRKEGLRRAAKIADDWEEIENLFPLCGPGENAAARVGQSEAAERIHAAILSLLAKDDVR